MRNLALGHGTKGISVAVSGELKVMNNLQRRR